MNNIVFNLKGDILGVKRFKGLIEGNEIDQCKVLVTTPMDVSTGNSLGFSVSEYRFGVSSNFDRFQGLQFPFKADLTIEMTTNGKTQKLTLLDFKMIDVKKI